MSEPRHTDACNIRDEELDQELTECLIAISVIAKRLAQKITANQKSNDVKEAKDVQELRTGGKDHQSEV